MTTKQDLFPLFIAVANTTKNKNLNLNSRCLDENRPFLICHQSVKNFRVMTQKKNHLGSE